MAYLWHMPLCQLTTKIGPKVAYMWHFSGICHIYATYMAQKWHKYGIFVAYMWHMPQTCHKYSTFGPLLVLNRQHGICRMHHPTVKWRAKWNLSGICNFATGRLSCLVRRVAYAIYMPPHRMGAPMYQLGGSGIYMAYAILHREHV